MRVLDKSVRSIIPALFGIMILLDVENSSNHFAFAGRPLATEDAGVAGSGVFQLEIGNDYAFQNGDREFTFTPTPIVGLWKRLELSADFPASFVWPEEGKNREGFSDINLILKTLFVPETQWSPSVLLRSQIKFENGNEEKELGSGDEDFGLISVFTKEIKSFTFHANVGYIFVGSGKDETLRDFIPYGFAGECRLTERIKVVAEMYVETGSHFDSGGAEHHHGFNPLAGLTFQLTKNVVLDTGFRVSFADEERPEYGLVAGVSVSTDMKEWLKK